MSQKQQPTVAIAGGGLAGLAAACALADVGLRVSLFERRPYLGGRASSYEHPGTGEVIDNCQHVLFRTCTNLIEFYRRIGVEDQIRWYEDMTFVEPGGRATIMRASPLPAPLHTGPSFLGFPFLSFGDKLAISRAIARLTLTQPQDVGKSFLEWCQHHGQTQTAIDRFWKPILVSALSEDLDLISVPSAAQVVRESMKSPAARHMGVPAIPLTELYNAAGDYIRSRGGEIRFRQPLEKFCDVDSGVRIQVADKQGGEEGGVRQELFDNLILALPFHSIARVLPQTAASAPLLEHLKQFKSCPITGIHLWFDRPISDLDHAVLLDRTVQWMFHKSRLLRTRARLEAAVEADSNNGDLSHAGSYIELVVSASKNLIDKSRAEIVELVLSEVREFFPAAREAKLLKSAVVKELHATYSPRPGLGAHRPGQTTPWPGVFLAGDWTATGWPATMEGAVRSGYLAAEAVARALGMEPHTLVSPDLAASGLMRFFC